jgi:hypothetical protein
MVPVAADRGVFDRQSGIGAHPGGRAAIYSWHTDDRVMWPRGPLCGICLIILEAVV